MVFTSLGNETKKKKKMGCRKVRGARETPALCFYSERNACIGVKTKRVKKKKSKDLLFGAVSLPLRRVNHNTLVTF